MVTIYLKYDKKEIQIPSSFAEITLQQWRELSKPGLTLISLVERLTGYDLTGYDQNALLFLGDALSTLLQPPDLDSFRWCSLMHPKLEDCTFEQVVRLEMALNKEYPLAVDRYEACLQALDIDTNITAAEAIALMQWYVEQINTINTAWKNQMPPNTTSEERQAGISQFDQFGRWGTVRRLAGGDPLKMPGIWQLPYKEVYQHCLYLYIEGNFQRRYQEIIMKRK